MAVVAFQVAGAIVGSYLGSPAIGAIIGSSVGSALFASPVPADPAPVPSSNCGNEENAS